MSTGPQSNLSAPAGYSSSDLVFNDNFSGTSLDQNWNPYITSNAARGSAWNSNGSGGSNEGGSYVADYDLPSQISVSDGLTLTATRQSTNGYPFTGAAVSSYGHFEFTGGYLQISMQQPSGNGAWPALWLLPGQGAGRSGDNFEIDMQEGGFTNGSNPNGNIGWHLHTSGGTFGRVTNVGTDLSSGLHTYGIDWEPGKSITWFLDGKQVGQVTSAQTTIPTEPMELIMNSSVANSNAAGWHTAYDSSTPSSLQMQVADVQLYQHAGSGETVLGSNVTASSTPPSGGTTTTGTSTSGGGTSGTTTTTGSGSGAGTTVTDPTGTSGSSSTSSTSGGTSTSGGGTSGTTTTTGSGSGAGTTVTDPTNTSGSSSTTPTSGSTPTSDGGTSGTTTTTGSGSGAGTTVTDPTNTSGSSSTTPTSGGGASGTTTTTGSAPGAGTTVTDPTGTSGSSSTGSTPGSTSTSGDTSSTPTAPTAPTVTLASSSVHVSSGGSISLGIGVTVPNAGDNVTVNISGLPGFETITDNLDHKTFSGNSVTLTAAEVDSGITLNSSYKGRGHPTSTLTVTATDNTGAQISSAPQTITVVDPSPTTVSGAGSSWGSGRWGSGAAGHGTPTGSRHPSIGFTSSGGWRRTSSTTSVTSPTTPTSSDQPRQHGRSDLAHWFDHHSGFAPVATTLSEAGSWGRGSASATPAATTPVGGTGSRTFALFNQMMAGHFSSESHFAQATMTSSAASRQPHQFLARPLH